MVTSLSGFDEMQAGNHARVNRAQLPPPGMKALTNLTFQPFFWKSCTANSARPALIVV